MSNSEQRQKISHDWNENLTRMLTKKRSLESLAVQLVILPETARTAGMTFNEHEIYHYVRFMAGLTSL